VRDRYAAASDHAPGSDVAPLTDSLRHRGERRFVWLDGIAAAFILLFAASNAGGWVQHLPMERLLVRALWWLLYLGASLRLVHRFGAAWLTWMTRHQWALCLLLAWSLLSTLWSLVALETLHKSLSLVGTTILGVYIGYTLPPALLARVLRWSFAAVIVSSLVAPALIGDSIAVEPLTGFWRGLMVDKNAFGAMAAMASLCFLAAALRRGAGRVWGWAMGAACLSALVLSHSRTALVACVVGVSTIAWFAAVERRRASPWVGLLLLLLLFGTVGGAAIYAREPLTGMIRKGAGLNGRTELWAGALQIIRERPLTGYGYHVVWGRMEKTLLPHIPITKHPSAKSAHNAFFDTATELGVPAAVLLVVYGVHALLDAVRFFAYRASSFSLFVLAFLMATATISITEANMLGIHWVFWILFVAIAIMLKRSRVSRVGDSHTSCDGRFWRLRLWKRGIEGDLFDQIPPGPPFPKGGTSLRSLGFESELPTPDTSSARRRRPRTPPS
jgi:O-antigen ligase